MLQCTRSVLLPCHARSISSHITPWDSKTLQTIEETGGTKDHNNVVEYLEHKNEKVKKFKQGNKYSRYYGYKSWSVIKKPSTQRFLDQLHDKMMADKAEQQREKDEWNTLGNTGPGPVNPGTPPDNLLVLDHLTYLEQEQLFREWEESQGVDNTVSMQTGKAVNKFAALRNPYKIMKNHGLKAGLKDLKDVGKLHALCTGTRRYKDLKNKQSAQIPGSELVSNTSIAKHLQALYISHFEAIKDKEWVRLRSMLAHQVAPHIEEQFKDRHVHWELVKEEKKPKILSNMIVTITSDVKVNQVLARFKLRVKYTVLEPGQLMNRAEMPDDTVVEYYVVFEKLLDHRHRNWIIVERVSKDDVEHYRNHIAELEKKPEEDED